jgi:hypothetical protein
MPAQSRRALASAALIALLNACDAAETGSHGYCPTCAGGPHTAGASTKGKGGSAGQANRATGAASGGGARALNATGGVGTTTNRVTGGAPTSSPGSTKTSAASGGTGTGGAATIASNTVIAGATSNAGVGGSTFRSVTGGAPNIGAAGNAAALEALCGTAGASALPLPQGGASACAPLVVDARPAICGALSADPHLVAFYPFNGTLADLSPNPNPQPGTLAAAGLAAAIPWTQDRFGVATSALHFDGQTSVDIPNASRLNGMQAFTLSAWVNAEATNDGIILSKVTPNRDFVMKFESTAGGVLSAHFAINYSEYYFAYGSAVPMPSSVWTFVAVVWTGCRWGVYLNGVLVGEREVTNAAKPAWTGTLLQIGNSAAGNVGFRGVIDDVRIYDKALTDNELGWVMAL